MNQVNNANYAYIPFIAETPESARPSPEQMSTNNH